MFPVWTINSSERLIPILPARSRRTQMDEFDVDKQSEIEKADNDGSDVSLSSNDLELVGTRGRTVLVFSADDPENPFTWHWVCRYQPCCLSEISSDRPQAKKLFVVLVSILCVMNSTVSSGLASNSAPYFGRDFGITSHELLVLPTSIFLLGYTVGPVFFGPMSEQYGRKYVMLGAFASFAVFTMAAALAPNYASLVVFRFLAGIGAACAITVVGG